MEDKFKKKLTEEEFGEQFAKYFPTSEVCSVIVDKIPAFLTNSEDLQQKTQLINLASRALIGMRLYIYRYDKKDEIIETPVNVDCYVIDNNLNLFQRMLPHSEHRLTSGSFALIRERLS